MNCAAAQMAYIYEGVGHSFGAFSFARAFRNSLPAWRPMPVLIEP
jgi:hypothetical protein